MHRKTLLLILTPVAVVAMAGASFFSAAQSAPADRPAAVAHAAEDGYPAGLGHQITPKRLEAIFEIDMEEFAFSTPDGLRNPAVAIPSGKTVGIHLHNEGSVMHELVIGRKPVRFVEQDQSGTNVVVPDGYDVALFEGLDADDFSYYGESKAELGGARFEEPEIDPGIRDLSLRLQFPPEMAGEWELGCFVPGRYQAGMYATLIVQ